MEKAVEVASGVGQVAMEEDVIVGVVATGVATIAAEAVARVADGMTDAEARAAEVIAGGVQTMAIVHRKRSRLKGSMLHSNRLRPLWPGWLS